MMPLVPFNFKGGGGCETDHLDLFSYCKTAWLHYRLLLFVNLETHRKSLLHAILFCSILMIGSMVPLRYVKSGIDILTYAEEEN